MSTLDVTASPRRRLRRKVGWLLFAVVLLVVAGPWIIARTPCRDWLINRVIGTPDLFASTEHASFGWFAPLSVEGLRIKTTEESFRSDIQRVSADKSWPRLLASWPDLGTLTVEQPHVSLTLPLAKQVAPDVRRVPTFNAEVSDAALTIARRDAPEPLVHLTGVDLTASVRDSDQVQYLSIAPVEIYTHETLSPEHCRQLLALIAPSLNDAAEIEGEFSLSVGQLRVPIGVSEAEMTERLELDGELALHEVILESDNALLQTVSKLVADLYQRPVPSRTRVAKDALISFQVRNGRVHHEGLDFGFPEIDPNLKIRVYGSVGLDRSLDTFLEIPRLDPEKQRQRGPVRCHLTGTIDNPQLSAKDASLVVRLPDQETPLIDFDNVDLTAHVETDSDGRSIVFDPIQVLDHQRIDRRLAQTLLRWMEPDLDYSPSLEGDVSLSLETLRVPLQAADQDWTSRLQADGVLTIHQATSDAQTPIRQAVVKLVSDLYAKPTTDVVRVARDAAIDFHVRDRRLHFEGMRAGFPDIDPGLTVAARGSIGLDQTLDIRLELPRLDPQKQRDQGPVQCDLTGTVSEPQLSAKDVSLVVRLPGRTKPLIDIDGVDLKIRVQEHQGKRFLSVGPTQLLDHALVTKHLTTGLLDLVSPDLEYSPKVEGEVSLSIDTLQIPLGVSDDQWIEAVEARGRLEIHQVRSLVQSPLRMAAAKLLADLYGIRLEESIRVVHESEVEFDLREGRFQFTGLRFGFPDIDPELQLQV